MTAARKRFSQEFKDELCQEVIATSKPIREVAAAYGVGTETLRKWLNKYRHTHGGTETELTVSERARLKELEREVCDLRAEALFLKKQRLTSRGSSDSEQVFADLKSSDLAHLPSGSFHARATTATIRRRIITVPARITTLARRLTMHLPSDWP